MLKCSKVEGKPCLNCEDKYAFLAKCKSLNLRQTTHYNLVN